MQGRIPDDPINHSVTRIRSARPRRLALASLIAVSAVWGWLEPAGAGAPLVRQERLVHRFDFLETDEKGNLLGQGHQWPPHWYAIGRPPDTDEAAFLRQPLHRELSERPGHPRYTRLGYNSEHSTVGPFSFHLGLDGGNAGAFLEVGTVPAIPGSDYLVTADVRTEHLQLARGFLSAYFVDDNGRRVDASVETSQPLHTEGEWTTVALKLAGELDRAAWIGIELMLRQPTADPAHPLGAQQIVLQDVRGAMWVDNIGIWQVPHVAVGTQSPLNVLHAPNAPRIESHVRDLSGRGLIAELNVYDHRMQRVDSQRFRIGQGAPMRWHWTPSLPALGWYLIELEVHDRDDTGEAAQTPVARTLGAMLWLPEQRTLHQRDRHRFSLPAEGMSASRWSLLPKLLKATGVEHTVISAWDEDTSLHAIEDRVEQIDGLLQQMYGTAANVGVSLDPLPRELLERDALDTQRPIEMFAAPPELWEPYLSPILLRHGPRVRQWGLGLPSEALAAFEAALPQTLEHITGALRRMAPRPHLVVPWRLDQSRRADLERSPAPEALILDIDVPPAIMASELPEYLESWGDTTLEHRLSLRTAPADGMAHKRRVTDLALRMIESWRFEGPVLQLRRPWTKALRAERAILPDPLLGVFTNVAHQLAGRRVVGELSVGEGLECLILDGPAGGALVAWNRSAPDDEAQLEMYLGEQPRVHDVWGNVAPVELHDGIHRVMLDRKPRFITGIDPKLALFRAGFAIDEPLIESLQMPHERTVVLVNPWPRTISGHMTFMGPAGWQHQPSRHFFSIPSGERVRLPVRFQFPIAEVAGPKSLEARFEFTADRAYDVEVATPMELGLSDVDFDASVGIERSEAGTRDAVVTAIITNRGDSPQALYVFANLAGHARQERLIAQLEPGQSEVRRFRFRDAAQAVREQPIRAGVRETAGPAILNYRLSPEP